MEYIHFQKSLFNNMQIGMFIIDDSKKILNINPMLENMVTISKCNLIGNSYSELIKQVNTTHMCLITQSMKNNEIKILYNTVLKVSKTKSIPIKLITIPIVKNNKVMGSCIMVIPKNQMSRTSSCNSMIDIDFLEFGLIGESSIMHEVYYLIKTVAHTDATVLILGETGTGKEIIANIIYKLSTRNNNNFIPINCAALSENLLENELFGHEKGSYTGAIQEHKGIFETASIGTIFLDEIGEISPKFQAKLLRILESGEYKRIGSVVKRKTNARIIAATNKNLKNMVQEKKFRDDLYYRLNIFPISIPPLRDRITDIPLLIDFFINELNKKYNINKLGVSEVALTLLFRYRFPGNVRELKNIIEHAYIKGKNEIIQAVDLPDYFLEEVDAEKVNKSLDTIDAKIVNLLEIFNGNKTKVARSLGISRKTLYNKLKRMDLNNSVK